MLVKPARIVAGATYPDFGCARETFGNPGVVELETLGPGVRRCRKNGAQADHWPCWMDSPGL